jgi:alpha-mannosidase
MIRNAAMTEIPPRPLYYTFGNHMHWVDMQWLWGYEVLPGCTEDMLRFCTEAKVRGNVNFDGIGYEKMAAECPESLAKLRDAVADGTLEPVGCSWGQPYGLFQGGESNLRQFEFGHRVVRKHLGVRPRAFWEEEFWFFPQLPQILAGFGYTGACLFFQWTWHTPDIPDEESEIIRWQGMDGTTLPTLPRNGLNLHQWPEDFDPMLASPLLDSLAKPALVQWIELMPSPDWMCRSEVLLPRMQELAADPRFDLQARTLSKLIEELDRPDAPVRAYHMDQVWHGMSLGKNGDAHPRASLGTERETLKAESIATMTAMLGRPYPSWDVYPHWELEEAWREQLAAQHHDNHECEGLCGFLGHDQFAKAATMAKRVTARSLARVGLALDPRHGSSLAFNPLPWTRDLPADGKRQVIRSVPGCGYKQADPETARATTRSEFPAFPLRLTVQVENQRELLFEAHCQPDSIPETKKIDSPHCARGQQKWTLRHAPQARELRLQCQLRSGQWDAGMNGALALDFDLPDIVSIRADFPFGESEVDPAAERLRKYPSGDWMTSEQWFETVAFPFTSQSYVQIETKRGSLLLVHDGAQAWQLRPGEGLRQILNVNDPWDEQYQDERVDHRVWILDGSDLQASQRKRIAMELLEAGELIEVGAVSRAATPVGGGDPRLAAPLASEFSALTVEGDIVASAFRRLGPHEADGLPEWVGKHMTAPHLVRLVELDGVASEGVLRFGIPVAEAVRTNHLAEPDGPDRAAARTGPHTVRVQLRPHEIQTVIVDLPDAAKQARDLDARRKVWAQIHRTEEQA